MRQFTIIILAIITASCTINKSSGDGNIEEEKFVFTVNESGEGPWISLDLERGESFYYPLMAIWLEDMDGNYIQTLYVPKSVATSVFRFGEINDNRWNPGIRRHPQTLPYWAHKRGIKASDGLYMPDPDNPIPDAYTGETPISSFQMSSKTDKALDQPVRILLEINQNWDWNEYWTNDLYPDDEYYKLSCQPALVYEAVLNPALSGNKVQMRPIGHSHHSGATGELFEDISTLTTALDIAESITVKIGREIE